MKVCLYLQASICFLLGTKFLWLVVIGPRQYPPFDGAACALLAGVGWLLLRAASEAESLRGKG